MAAELQLHTRPVEGWLAGLGERKRSVVLQYAAAERSVVLSYLYATMLGMEVSIDDWEAFVVGRWKKLDHRAILESEIVQLHQDLADLRRLAEEGGAAGQGGRSKSKDDVATRIAYLSKELRGHIEHLAKEVGAHDRRTLVLAGVEITGKMLRKVFGRDANVWPAIEAALESAWADIEAKHQG